MYTKLGIIGGMGPSATLNLYRGLIEGRAARRDQDHINMVVLNDSTIPDRTAAILHGGESPLGYILADCKRLADCGCDIACIPCNTSHYFYEQIAAGSPIPVLNMIDLTAASLTELGVSCTYLLATEGTIRTGIYKRAVERQSIKYIDPSCDEMAVMMRVIYDIKAGVTPPLEPYFELIRKYRDAGCQRIILGCTELSLIEYPAELSGILVDSSQVLIDHILKIFA